MRYSDRSKKYLDSISMDITPLIDVVFLLLLFFLVGTTLKKNELAFLVGLPKTENGQGSTKLPKQIMVEISKDGYAVNGKVISVDQLESTLKQREFKKDLPVYIRADETISYKQVTQLLDALQSLEFSKISLVTEKKK